MSSAAKLIQGTIVSVERGDLVMFGRFLEAINLKTLDTTRLLKLGKMILGKLAVNNSSYEMFQTYYDAFTHATSEQEKFIGLLILDPSFEDQTIFVLNKKLDLRFETYILALASFRDTSQIEAAFLRLRTIFPLAGPPDYQIALDMIKPRAHTIILPNKHNTEFETQTYVNPQLFKILQEVLEDSLGYHKIPEWVEQGVFYGGSLPGEVIDDPEDRMNISRQLPEPSEAADYLLRDMIDNAMEVIPGELELRIIREEILKAYSQSNSDMLLARLLQPVYISLFLKDDDLERKKLYGPANPYVNKGDPDLYTSCRMFEYNNPASKDIMDRFFEGDVEDEQVNYIDWFTGKCDACGRKIRQYWHAVRIPLECGGWSGCYGDWKCAMDDLPKSISDNALQFEPGPIRKRLIKHFATEMNRDRIYDRFFEEPLMDPSVENYVSQLNLQEHLLEDTKESEEEMARLFLQLAIKPSED